MLGSIILVSYKYNLCSVLFLINIYVDLKDAFRLFDKNNDGHISLCELANVMRVLGNNPTDEDIQEIFNSMDEDSN